MSQSYISQVQPFAFNFAPKNWALCSGTVLSIAQNQALFALLGTTYGGNGVSTFALPNLQSRVPLHAGNDYVEGEMSGTENVTLIPTQLPQHTHDFSGTSTPGNTAKVVDSGVLAQSQSGGNPAGPYYGAPSPVVALNPAAVSTVGGNQPHTNLQPYLAVNWCICMYGIFPPRG
jgi:microcystin-dependent protein